MGIGIVLSTWFIEREKQVFIQHIEKELGSIYNADWAYTNYYKPFLCILAAFVWLPLLFLGVIAFFRDVVDKITKKRSYYLYVRRNENCSYKPNFRLKGNKPDFLKEQQLKGRSIYRQFNYKNFKRKY